MCYADSFYIPHNKSERICCAIDCHCCNKFNQCSLVKLSDSRFLPVVGFLSSRSGTLIQSELFQRDFILNYFYYRFIGDCRKFV